MKKILLISTLFFGLKTFGQLTVTNALIVLPNNTCTLTASGGSGGYTWTEVSAHTISVTGFSVADNMTSGATITNNNDGTATLSNVNKQGTYYFKVTNGGNSAIMALNIRVVQPIPITYIWDSLINSYDVALTAHANNYGNTAHQFSYNNGITTVTTANNGAANTLFSDDYYGNHRLYTVLSSNAGSPHRTELQFSGNRYVDTSKVIVYEWQGYFTDASAAGKTVYAWMFQEHAANDYTPPFTLSALNGELGLDEYHYPYIINGATSQQGCSNLENAVDPSTGIAESNTGTYPFILNNNQHDWYIPVTENGFLSQLTQAPHTIRVTFKEGKGNGLYAPFVPQAGSTALFIPNAPQKAFLKIEVDGKQVYLRNNGNVGTDLSNWDQRGALEYPNRWGQDYKLVTGAYNDGGAPNPLFSTGVTQVQTVSNTYQFGTGGLSTYGNDGTNVSTHGYTTNQIQLPYATATASSVSGGAATLYGYGNNITGYIVSRHWTKTSGGSAIITNANSDTTTITGLGSGSYTFQLAETDNYGQTAFATVNVGTGSGPTAPSIVINSGSSPFPSGTTSVSLTATSSASAGISHYNWSYTGTAGASFSASTSSTTNITGLSDGGSYSIQVYATDNNGVTSAITNLNISVNSSGQSSLLTGIVSYWKLDEGSGTSAADAVGSNTGTNTSATVGATGKINTAYSFNGSSSKVDMNVNSSLQPTTGSISVWVKLNSLSTDQVIVSNGNVSSDTYGVTLEYNHADNGFDWEVANGSAHQYGTISGTITTGVWYNIILTWNGFYVNTYLNGVGNQIAQTQAAAYSNNHFVLGYNYATNSFYLNGTIDEVGLWNRVLLPGEVSTLYNAGYGNQYPFGGINLTIQNASLLF